MKHVFWATDWVGEEWHFQSNDVINKLLFSQLITKGLKN
jgi:hypothetical protein